MRRIIIFILVSFMVVFSSGCDKKSNKKRINTEPQSSKMMAICELATMDCYYHNVAKFTEEDASGILLWKKDKKFWIEYSGIVTIGIDASSLMVEVKDTEVSITIPKAKVLSSKVDDKTLSKDSFYVDSSSADISAEDETAAFKEAQKDMTKKASSDEALLASAQQRAQSLLEDYVHNIGDAIGKEYTIKWVYEKEKK